MNRFFLPALVAAGILSLTGCTHTTVRVDRVLHTPSQKLKDTSPSGRKVLVALESLRQFQAAQAQIQQQIESLCINQPKVVDTPLVNVTPVTNLTVALKEHFQAPLKSLKEQQDKVDAQIAVFCGFFENTNAIGMAPRVDWEIAKTIMLLDQQKPWVKNFDKSISQSKNPKVLELLRCAGSPTVSADQLESAINNLTNQVDQAISVAAKEGFGGFLAIGIAEINASDPEYQVILNSEAAKLSQDAISKSSSTISGDAQVIIVQESPAQFRTYQISNDPTTLMKNIAMLVAKATAAAAKYLSGGIAP